jgi:uncharacterized membrane protein YhaH (DUF805 family)
MTELFSTKGTVGRRYFLVCAILHVLAVPAGMAICLVISLLSSPIGSNPDAYLWSEENANWVKEYLGWTIRGWYPTLLVIGIYLVAYRIFSCAYVKRARAIGVELTTGEVYYCFMGFQPGANLRDLLKRHVNDS